jgi:hypothetical protein
MSAIADLIAQGKEFGIFQFYLPFVLAFAIIYAILGIGNVFGKDKRGKNINLIVALILALFLMVSPVGELFAGYIGTLFGGSVLVVVTIIATMMILYVLGHLVGLEIPMKGKEAKWVILLLLIAVLLALGVFIMSGGMAFFPGLSLPGFNWPTAPTMVLPSIGLSTTDIAIILMVIGTGAIIYWISQSDKGEK